MRRKRQPNCSVCRHEERWRIELLRAGGASLDAIAAKFAPISRDIVHRHWRDHVTDEAKANFLCGPSELAKLGEKAAAEGDSVIDYLRMCRNVLVSQMATMAEAGDGHGTAKVAGALTRTLEVMARTTGELGALAQSINITNNNVAIMNSPQFANLTATLLRALAPFPEARGAVALALRGIDVENAPAASAANAMKVIEHVDA